MSNRWPGGLIRKTPVTPAGPFQCGAASGVWTLAEAAFWTKQGLWPTQGNTLAVEDVFSTWLYTGNGSTQTITNGINLSGQGGLVWVKSRTNAGFHAITDTARGVGQNLYTNSTLAQFFDSTSLTAFSSSGFSLGADAFMNGNGQNYVSWTFREAPNFFDVVTYTGNGANRTIAHNLGVAPGMILVKRTDASANWQVYHRSNANTQYMVLNDTAAVATGATRWNSTTPTSTEFSVGTDATVNASGGTYVAYLFAHVTGSDGIIQCGSYTGNGSSTGPVVTLGWEPQWLMVKNASAVGGWDMYDSMRGLTVENDALLRAQSANAEVASIQRVNPTATGFQIATTDSDLNTNGDTYIYVAIRRGPMRTPTLGTSVFFAGTASSSVSTYTTGFPVDLAINPRRDGSPDNQLFADRLRGSTTTNMVYLVSSSTAAESSASGFGIGLQSNTTVISSGLWGTNPQAMWAFRRAPGFFDEVCYTGTGTNGRTVAHNLGVAPEMIILKSRSISSSASRWPVYTPALLASASNNSILALNSDSGIPFLTKDVFGNTAPTSSVFTVNALTPSNEASATYVAYLFASCPGVSKVGSYTGNGSSQTINCAFTTGARYVLIKRTDSTGDWYVWDSARGIVAGNDPYLALNSTAAEVTSNDSVDTDSTGFIVNQVSASNVNVSAATYIFLAIA